MRWRYAAVAGCTLVVLGTGAAVTLGRWNDGRSDRPPSTVSTKTTSTVNRQTLSSRTQVDGNLGFGAETPLTSKAPGTITWLPGAGSTIRRGGTLLRADNHPVVLLSGSLPIYRPLVPGTTGDDVTQLEKNLSALGYRGFTIDDHYTSGTAGAVRHWQHDLGRPESGQVDSSWVVALPGDVRIGELRARVGDAAGGVPYSYTGTRPGITVNVDVDQSTWARKGVEVTVTMPDGKPAKGTVEAVSAKVQDSKEGGSPTVAVTVRLADAAAAGALSAAPVKVTYVSSQRRDVLAVPVVALLALAEGGYGVEVVAADGTSSYLAVKVGLFAGGQVEISGPGVTAGLRVAVPQ
jgi:hypothetical protein